jgi:hypothetical protein
MDLFPADSVGRKQLTTIAAAIADAGTDASAKMTAARDGTTSKARTRDALATSLEAVARTARAIALDTPGLEDKFFLGGKSDQELITAGRTFARDAVAFAVHFIAHGMPKTFIGGLGAVVDAFEQAIHDRQAKVDAHLAARGRIEVALASAMAALRKLDAIVANALHDDPVTMQVWKRDRRVRAARSEKKEAATPDGPTLRSAEAAIPADADALKKAS